MPEVWFYHLTQQPLTGVLPSLLEKATQRGWRVVVETPSPDRVRALDDLLWSWSADSFLPHGSERDGDAPDQPIWLTTTSENPNGAQLRICADGARAEAAVQSGEAYERVILVFDGADEDALADARAQWKSMKQAGYTLSYWQQGETGGWEKKA